MEGGYLLTYLGNYFSLSFLVKLAYLLQQYNNMADPSEQITSALYVLVQQKIAWIHMVDWFCETAQFVDVGIGNESRKQTMVIEDKKKSWTIVMKVRSTIP